MKHASLKEAVGVFKRYKPRAHPIQGQLLPDLVTGERGREPIITAINYHVDTPTDGYAVLEDGIGISSSTGAPSISSSTADAARAVTDPLHTTTNRTRTFYSHYESLVAKGENPHYAVPFSQLFGAYVQQRHGEVRALLEHPDAPMPCVFLEQVCAVSYPDLQCARDVILSELERKDRHIGNGALRIWHIYKRCEHLQGPVNDATYELVDLMVRALVSVSATDGVVEALDRIPNDFIRPQTWDMLLMAVAKRRIRSAEILWRLVGPQSFHVTAAGQYGLSAEFATVLLTRTRISGYSYSPPLVGKAIMTRYFQFCAATQVPLHPTPFLFFFKLVRDARAGTDSTLFHWHIVWEYLQKLNAECPQWYEKFPEEAEQLCCFLVDIMLKGADPWMVLNVSRSIASRHIVDGFELSLRILRRLEPYEHHPAETRAVAKKLFSWLLDTVKIHLIPKYQPQVIPAMQSLVRLGMLSELSRFHNSILDSITVMPEQFKRDFYYAFEDVLCSSCHGMLESAETTVDRQCPYCQTVKPAKEGGGGDVGDANDFSAAAAATQNVASTVVLLSSVAEMMTSSTATSSTSVLDEGVIDISAAFQAAQKDKRESSNSAAAAEKAVLSSSSFPSSVHHGGGLPDGSGSGMYLRKGPSAAVDGLPQTGTATGAMWREVRRQREEEGSKLKGSLERLQKEQPTRQGLLDRSRSPPTLNGTAAADGKGSSSSTATSSTDAAAGVFVPAVGEEERAMAAGGKSSADAVRRKAEQSNDVRAELEDEASRAALQMRAKRLALQRGEGRGAVGADGAEGAGAITTTTSTTAASDEGGGSEDATGGFEAALPPFVERADHTITSANDPSSSSSSSNRRHHDQKGGGRKPQRAAPTSSSNPRPSHWNCVWCQEKNASATTEAHCSACGAETGPLASWRTFAYASEATMSDNNASGNNAKYAAQQRTSRMIMDEIRQRILHCYERPEDGVVAAYYLMVYRRLFLLKANSSDFALVEQLVASLAASHERVLAGYVYVRLVPTALRRLDSPALQRLASLFGTSTTAEYQSLTAEDLASDSAVCAKVLGPATCKVCYGSHDWTVCPIVTRDFRTMMSRVRLTPEEQHKGVMEGITKAVRAAVEEEKRGATAAPNGSSSSSTAPTAACTQLAINAYKLFVSFKRREEWAVANTAEANALSQLLSASGEMLRAAFVLCHIPLHVRENESYLRLASHFGVERIDVESVLARRSPAYVADNTHPNIVQVTMTCCICLEGKHASFNCPNLHQWARTMRTVMRDVHADKKAYIMNNTNTNSAPYNPHLSFGAELQQLKLLVEGWTYSGPERLHAFYRFLLTNMDAFTALNGDASSSSSAAIGSVVDAFSPHSPLYHAVNTTICRLVETGVRRSAWRLFARTPVKLLSTRQSVVAILKMNGVDDGTLKHIVDNPTMADSWIRESSLPIHTHCLICFDRSHGFQQCPELVGKQSVAERLSVVLTNVGGIRCTRVGITAAADYVADVFNRGELIALNMKHNSVGLARGIARLALQCFASSEVFRGRRLMRLLPPEMVEMDLLDAYWKSAGVPSDEEHYNKTGAVPSSSSPSVEGAAPPHGSATSPTSAAVPITREYLSDCVDQFCRVHKFIPSMEQPPSFAKPPKFRSLHRKVTSEGACERCGEYSHGIAQCLLYRNEASFARDMIASFRCMMVAQSMPPAVLKVLLMRYAKFLILYEHHLPFELKGVQRAANAIAAFCAMVHEPGIALRLLLSIPAAYRQKHVFIHTLHALGVTAATIEERLTPFLTTGDDQQDVSMAVAMSSLRSRTPIPDEAMRALFADMPSALSALRIADEVILSHTDHHVVVRENERRSRLLTDPSASAGSSNSLSAAADALSRLPPLSIRPVQFADIIDMRDTFEVTIQTPVENIVGYSIGSKHQIYAAELIAAEAAAASSSSPSEGSAGHGADVEFEVVEGEVVDEGQGEGAVAGRGAVTTESRRERGNHGDGAPLRSGPAAAASSSSSSNTDGAARQRSTDDKYSRRSSSSSSHGSSNHYRSDGGGSNSNGRSSSNSNGNSGRGPSRNGTHDRRQQSSTSNGRDERSNRGGDDRRGRSHQSGVGGASRRSNSGDRQQQQRREW